VARHLRPTLKRYVWPANSEPLQKPRSVGRNPQLHRDCSQYRATAKERNRSLPFSFLVIDEHACAMLKFDVL